MDRGHLSGNNEKLTVLRVRSWANVFATDFASRSKHFELGAAKILALSRILY